jgi:UDP-hydrolysing UDP-N-acetyl-D-glucosamine 2-epimerase
VTKRTAVFTGTRAEYGLLYWLLKDIEADPDLKLQLLVSGTHLSPEFGCTVNHIEKDGFDITEKVEMLLSSNTSVGVAKSIGLGVLGYSDALSRMQPDVLVVLGDRFEALAIVQTAMIMRIPVLHLHGGEITEGAYDDAIRHAITKLSTIHCVSTAEHRQRVIQLGEAPDRVFNVGAIGLDHISRSEFLDLDELRESLGFPLSAPYLIVTYHPVTLVNESPTESFRQLLSALDEFPEYQLIITYPNADDGGRSIIPMIEDYAAINQGRVLAIPSLGYQRYLSAVKHAAAVIGNSSSGIIEVPSFNIPTINIGARQKGRMSSQSISHCAAEKSAIFDSLRVALKDRSNLCGEKFSNPYGQGSASKQIVEIIKTTDFSSIKSFYDLEIKGEL